MKIITTLILVLLILVSGLCYSIAQGTNMAIVSVEDYNIEYDSSIVIPIMVMNGTDILGGALNFSYDPSVIHILSITNGDIGMVTPNINNSEGFAYVNAFSTVEKSGDVVFAWVEISAIGTEDVSTTLEITVISLFNVTYNEVPFIVRNGNLTIIECPVNKTIILMDFSTGGNDARIVERTWNFYYANGTLFDTIINAKNITYEFPDYGAYRVDLTIENQCGNTDTYSEIILTGCPTPVAYFEWKRF